MPHWRQSQQETPYTFTIDKDRSVAVMNFNSFRGIKAMTHFADSMFTVLRENHVKKLIIDIRENGGGNSMVGDILLRYISLQSFAQMGKVFLLTSLSSAFGCMALTNRVFMARCPILKFRPKKRWI